LHDFWKMKLNSFSKHKRLLILLMLKKILPFVILIFAIFTYWNIVLRKKSFGTKTNMQSLFGTWQNINKPTEYMIISGGIYNSKTGFYLTTTWIDKPDYDNFTPESDGTIIINEDNIEVKYYESYDGPDITGEIIIIDKDLLRFPFGDYKRFN
jgi:hypothetical protein